MRLLGQIEAVALDVRIGSVEQRQVVLVAVGDVLRQVGGEAKDPVVEGCGHADQVDIDGRECTEVNGVSAACTADRDRDMLGPRGGVSASHRPSTPSHQQKSRPR